MTKKQPNKKPDVELNEAVAFVRELGLNILPLNSDKSPALEAWKYLQETKNTNEEFIKWFGSILKPGEFKQFGVIGGKVSGNLVIVDIDDAKLLDTLENDDLFKNTLTIQTARGKHFYFTTDYPVRGTKELKRAGLKIDIQGEGRYAVFPPAIHPTGIYYVFANKTPIKHVTGYFEEELRKYFKQTFNIKFEYSKINVKEILENGAGEGDRNLYTIQLATYFKINDKTLEEALDIILKWNETKNDPPDNPQDVENAVRWIYENETYDQMQFEDTEIFDAETIKKAEELIENPEEILRYIYQANAEVVGEDKNKILITLFELGKQSAEITGKTAGGKNTVVDACLRCVPRGWWEKITGLSDKAIRHFGKHLRTLYIAERKGMKSGEESSAEYDIKVGISEGKIKSWITQRVGEEFEVQIKETIIDNYITTSTEIAPPLELENRIYNLVIDESRRQNISVRDRQLDEMAKPLSQTINTENEKKVLRCLFEKIDALEIELKTIRIPYARKLQYLLPATDTSIRRHTPKLGTLIRIISKLFHKKLLEDDEGNLVATPEIFWYVWQIGDEAIFAQIIGLTRTQLQHWEKIRDLFIENAQLTINLIAETIKRDATTVGRILDYFELKGLIITRTENRMRIAELAHIIPEEDLTKSVSFTDLQKEYDSYIEKFGSSAKPQHLRIKEKKISLLDPLKTSTGIAELRKSNIVFNLPTVKPTVIEKRKSPAYAKNGDKSEKLEDFDNVLKRKSD